MGPNDQRFYAYELYERNDMALSTAPVDREWMDQSDQRFAYRCLPLTIANQAGWLLHSPATFTAWWDGGNFRDNVQLTFEASGSAAAYNPWSFRIDSSSVAAAPVVDRRISSHFGSGVVTFTIPFLFRTPPGVNLWVKGPSNWFKDGAHPLEGVVESDWLPATFTMNWKLTRPGHPVRFERGDPICMVVPVARGLAEGLEPLCLPLEREPEMHREYHEWLRTRTEFINGLLEQHPETVRRGWQKDYNKGLTASGARAPEHQTRLHLKEFTRVEGPAAESEGGT
jgi:hypothetical protein